MSLHVLEKLVATNPASEVWLDRSTLVYASHRQATLAQAPKAKRADWQGQLARMFDPLRAASGETGFGGVTTHPPLSLWAIRNDPDFWTARIRRIATENPGADVERICWLTYLETARCRAKMILPVYHASNGRRGHVSGQVDPRFVDDHDRMLSQGLELAALAPNLIVKIPGSAEGHAVIEELTARGISTHNTTSFTVAQYMACMQAVSLGLGLGLARAHAAGLNLSRWRSVITQVSSRMGNFGDLRAQADERGIVLTPDDIIDAEMAVRKRACHHGRATGHPSKMLQRSMRVVDDGTTAHSRHIADLAAGDLVYTCPPGFIAQLMQAEDRLPPFDATAIDREPVLALIEKLCQLPYFRQAYDSDGMAPCEFSQIAAFATTATEFAAATRKTVDFVARAMEDRQTRVA